MEKIYDMIVIGGGPAGYTAALYAARSGLSVLVLEKLSAGGQMALTEQIDNYPGFESGIDGFTLGEKMQQSAERFGAVTELAEVYKVSLSGRIKTLDTSEGVFQGRTVVIATGASPRPLGVPGEEALTGKGVHYCAACDGAPYRGKTVAVVGGGNSAAADALTLSRIAPAFDKVGEQFADTLITGKINYDEEPQLIERFGIDTIPTLILFKDGKVLGSIVAPGSKAAIEAFIKETLAQ